MAPMAALPVDDISQDKIINERTNWRQVLWYIPSRDLYRWDDRVVYMLAIGNVLASGQPTPPPTPPPFSFDQFEYLDDRFVLKEFLQSILKGDPGEPGKDGTNGTNGASAYDMWIDAGNVGTVADFLASLKGAKGDPGTGYAPPTGQAVVTANTADGVLQTPKVLDELKRILGTRSGSKPVGQGEETFNIYDFGARTEYADNSAFVQAALNACAAVGGGKVLVPPSPFRVAGIDQPEYVQVEATGGALTRFGTGTKRAAARFIRTVGSTKAYTWRIASVACVMRQIEIDGDNQAYRGLIVSGFELTLDTIRVINCKHIGIDVERANNTRWKDIYVDNCGTATDYAMRIWSKTGASTISGETNTLDIYGLTIERSANGALDVANGTTGEYWAEFLRIHNLHVEAPVDNGGLANTSPLVAIGNVRSVDFFGAFIYGGPGPLVAFNQVYTRPSGANGGVRFIGGQLFGSDTSNGTAATPTLVSLTAGDNFSLIGTKLNRYTGSPIVIGSSFGSMAFFSPDVTLGSGGTILDARASATLYSTPGDSKIDGVLETGRPVASIVREDTRIASVTANLCKDTGGTIFFQSRGTTAGLFFTINFAKPFRVIPKIAITPKNALTAALRFYGEATSDRLSVKIYCLDIPANTGVNAHQLDYIVTS